MSLEARIWGTVFWRSRFMQGSKVHLCRLCTAQLQKSPFYVTVAVLPQNDLQVRQNLKQESGSLQSVMKNEED